MTVSILVTQCLLRSGKGTSKVSLISIEDHSVIRETAVKHLTWEVKLDKRFFSMFSTFLLVVTELSFGFSSPTPLTLTLKPTVLF